MQVNLSHSIITETTFGRVLSNIPLEWQLLDLHNPYFLILHVLAHIFVFAFPATSPVQFDQRKIRVNSS